MHSKLCGFLFCGILITSLAVTPVSFGAVVDAIANFQGFNALSAADSLPPHLSQTQLFSDITAKKKAVTSGIIPYEVNVPYWTDGTVKAHFIQVPAGKKIEPGFGTTSCGPLDLDTNHYQFPDKTIFIQNIFLDTSVGDTNSRIYLETRFLIMRVTWDTIQNQNDTNVYGLSYSWRRDQTDADLINWKVGLTSAVNVRVNGVVKGKTWRFSSNSNCRECHVNRRVLGFTTPQLNRIPAGSTTNQLADFFTKQILSVNPIQGLTNPFKWAGINDTNQTLELRARSYFGANCSHCHGNDYFPAPHSFDFFGMSDTILFSDVTGGSDCGYVGKPLAFNPWVKLIYQGRPDSSYAVYRMLRRGTDATHTTLDQMPPVGTYQVDSAGVRLIENWICQLGGKPAQCNLPPPISADSGFTTPIVSPRFSRSESKGLAFFSGNRLTLAVATDKAVLTDIKGKMISMTRMSRNEYVLPETLIPGLYLLKFGEYSQVLSYLK